MQQGPLDMRMDRNNEETAADIVNTYNEEQLGRLIREFGEEPRWKFVVRTILRARQRKPIETTEELSSLLSDALGRKRGRLHPATLVFQALRIAVNRELEAVEEGIQKALNFLSIDGKIGTISFHRLEDRIVKNLFRKNQFRPKDRHGSGWLQLMTKKPWVPSKAETDDNPRARSAKMRFAQRVRGVSS